MTYQTDPLWHSKGTAKRKVIAICAYIKKLEQSQVNNLMMHLKLSEKTRK
jgi:hypothetical protein